MSTLCSVLNGPASMVVEYKQKHYWEHFLDATKMSMHQHDTKECITITAVRGHDRNSILIARGKSSHTQTQMKGESVKDASRWRRRRKKYKVGDGRERARCAGTIRTNVSTVLERRSDASTLVVFRERVVESAREERPSTVDADRRRWAISTSVDVWTTWNDSEQLYVDINIGSACHRPKAADLFRFLYHSSIY